MRLLESSSCTAVLVILGMVDLSSAWTSCLPKLVVGVRSSFNSHHHPHARRFAARGATTTTITLSAAGNTHNNNNFEDWTEFDYLLHEHADASSATTSTATTARSSRRVIQLGGGASNSDGAVVLTSSAAATAAPSSLDEATISGSDEASSGEYDPYASDMDYQQQQMGKIQQQQQNSAASLESRFKQMDLQDIVITLIIPGILSFVSLRWGFNQVASRLSNNADTLLDGFAREMIHHDGNFEEMRMCQAEYSRQLVWMGPKKGDAMLKRYLAAYAKKKTVSPQAIR